MLKPLCLFSIESEQDSRLNHARHGHHLADKTEASHLLAGAALEAKKY